MLPMVEGDHLICPYCEPKKVVFTADDLAALIDSARKIFQIRQAHYHLGEFCKECGTVWLCERVSPGPTMENPSFGTPTHS